MGFVLFFFYKSEIVGSFISGVWSWNCQKTLIVMPISATTFIKTVTFHHVGVMYTDYGNVTAAAAKVALYLCYAIN